MTVLPFEQLSDAMEFQRLCADLLVAEGCRNVRGLGTGPDQGKDIAFDLPVQTPLGIEWWPFIAQCKLYKPTNSVGSEEIVDVLGYLPTHNARGLLVITSSQFSGTATLKMDAIDRAHHHPYQLKYWSGFELSGRILKHPRVLSKYFHRRAADSTTQVEELAEYNFGSWLQKFAPPPRYESVSMESFPRRESNQHLIATLERYSESFFQDPALVTVVTGAIGAGKTGFAYSLVNRQAQAGHAIASVSSYEFEDRFFDYALKGDASFPAFLTFLADVDFLVLDDLGHGLRDASETQRGAAQALIEVVQGRITAKRPTVITSPPEADGSPTIQNFLEFLSRRYNVIHVGDHSVRNSLNWQDEDSITDIPVASVWLGRGWLDEKFEKLDRALDQCIDLLLTPTELYASGQRQMQERFGSAETKEEELLRILRSSRVEVKRYREFVGDLPFHAVRFDSDGSAEVIPHSPFEDESYLNDEFEE